MVGALCAIADDPGSTLIQRHLLDFLCNALPMDTAPSHLPIDDFVKIIRRCLFIVLRREMSLNKRLYQWLLNRPSDVVFIPVPANRVEEKHDLDFFKQHSLPIMKLAINEYLSLDTEEVQASSTSSLRSGTYKVGFDLALNCTL